MNLLKYRGFQLKRLGIIASNDMSKLMKKKLGISSSQWGVLILLDEVPGLTIKELQNLLQIKVSSASGIISRMEKDDLIYRVKQKDDLRVRKLFLTEHGSHIAQESQKYANQFDEMVFKNFSDEQKTLFTELIDKMFKNLV